MNDYTIGNLRGFLLCFGKGTLRVANRVNVMGETVSFGVYTLGAGTDMCLRLMHANCSRNYLCLSLMSSIYTSSCGLYRYLRLSGAAFMMPSAVEISRMVNLYGKNSTVSTTIYACVFF